MGVSFFQKRSISLLGLVIMVLLIAAFGGLKVSAETPEESSEIELEGSDVKLTVDSPYSIENEDGSVIFFDTEEEYNLYLEYSGEVQGRCATCNQTVSTLLINKTTYRNWINYHPLSSFWSKASNYLLTANTTYTINGSYADSGFTVGVSVAHSVGLSVSIPADSNRESRLGVYSDINFKRYKHVVKNPAGTIIDTYYSNHAIPVNTPSVVVVYR